MSKCGQKYNVNGSVEAQYEPESNRKVLKNLLGIKNKSEMNRVEALALKQAEDVIFREYSARHRFTAGDICHIHKLWLDMIYPWAGQYRAVNLSKGKFHFAAAKHIPQLMSEFEKDLLCKWTPCRFKDQNKVINALAKVHVELVLIHPFREGNGRIARLLSTLMALQAGLPLLDFSVMREERGRKYISAVHTGLNKNYLLMEQIFRKIISATSFYRREKK